MIANPEMANLLRSVLEQGGERQQVAKRIADAIRAAGPYRWVGIYDVDVQRDLVSNIAWSGPGAPAHPAFPTAQGITARAIATKKTINVGDVTNDMDYLTAFGSTRSEVIVPVLSEAGDRVVGTIDVESERLNAFDSAAQILLEGCAAILKPFWSSRWPIRADLRQIG